MLLMIGGLVATGWGIMTSMRAKRPRSFGGAVAAVLGLAIAMLGAVSLLVPGFL